MKSKKTWGDGGMFLGAEQGRGEWKPRFCNRSREDTSDHLGIAWHTTAWCLTLHLLSL